MKRVLLLRHASAGEGAPDAERPLSERGREEAARIAERLASLLPPPEVALCSTARRARETFEALRAVLAPPPGCSSRRRSTSPPRAASASASRPSRRRSPRPS